MANIITLREYIEQKCKAKEFVIPTYQRGYIWGKNRGTNQDDSVTYLLKTLKNGYFEYKKINNDNYRIFLQGVTVSEKDNEVILVDGQQRTTFFYLLLKFLGYEKSFTINYEVRSESRLFLKKINKANCNFQLDPGEMHQDIFFFKKTLISINNSMKEIPSASGFLEFILDHISFLYIIIDEDKAREAFTMMNGSKATMLPEELVKAEILRLVSISTKEEKQADKFKKDDEFQLAEEWERNLLRSRYAREWDKWLQWWNQKTVKQWLDTAMKKGPLDLLLQTFLMSMDVDKFTFQTFKNMCLSPDECKTETQHAKEIFLKIRRVQKKFEDAFNAPITYNKIGAIIRVLDKKDIDKFLVSYFINGMTDNQLNIYYLSVFLLLTHKEIMNDRKKEIFDQKYLARKNELSENDMYNTDYKESAFNLLLRLNIDEDNKQNENGRKFNFDVWKDRSLEHIYPKSKVWHITDSGKIEAGDGSLLNFSETDLKRKPDYLCRKSITNGKQSTWEHSIGNLVLLYGSENSSFGNDTFNEKKRKFFQPEVKDVFASRQLLNTIYKFANEKWDGPEIVKNKIEIIDQFEKTYDLLGDYYVQ